MKVEVLVSKELERPLWRVKTDLVSIPFSREPDAQSFANRLNARLNASHVWPGDAANQRPSGFSPLSKN